MGLAPRASGLTPHAHWPPLVASFCATSGGVTPMLDPLGPEDDEVWARLDALRPSAAAYLKPDHLRDVRLFHDRYGATVYGELYIKGARAPDLERFVDHVLVSQGDPVHTSEELETALEREPWRG